MLGLGLRFQSALVNCGFTSPVLSGWQLAPGRIIVPNFWIRVQGSGFGVHGLRFRVRCSGFRVQGSRFRVRGSGFRVQGSGFGVQDSGFRVRGLGFRV